MLHTPTSLPPIDHALFYIRHNLRVIPLHSIGSDGRCTCDQETCSSAGKHPRTKDGVKSATTEYPQIKEWWSRYPQANIGIATGEGLLVIDIDPRHGGSLEALHARVSLPETAMVRTGSGGWHLYYSYKQGLMLPNSGGKLAEGIDTRGHHGYVVAPPSLHASGTRYTWEHKRAIAPAPPALLDLLLTPKGSANSSRSADDRPSALYIPASRVEMVSASPANAGTLIIPEGKRNTRLLSVAGSYRRQGAGEEGMLLVLRAYNQAFCQPPLPDEEVIKIVRSAASWQEGRGEDATGLDDLVALVTIMNREMPEPQWAIPGLLREGVTLLAGKPKKGKSWLGLGLGLAVSAGQPALGTLPTRMGHVLYLGLEDTERRLKDRATILLQGRPIPYEFTWGGWWRPLQHGGLDDLELWLSMTDNARLIIIDTLAKVRSQQSNGSVYAEDYAIITPLKELAERYHVAIVLVHHLRKSSASDPMDEISGTTGLTGATDCNMVLQRVRFEPTAILHITGRDVDEQQLTLKFDEKTAAWTISTVDPRSLSPERQAILDVLLEQGAPMSADAIAAVVKGGIPDKSDIEKTRRLLSRMHKSQQIRLSGRGMYIADPEMEMIDDEE